MKVARIECGLIRSGWAMPAVLARRRMRRQAATRSRAVPVAVTKIGPAVRWPISVSRATSTPAVSGAVVRLLPLRRVAQHPVAVGEGQVVDAGGDGLADAQPVSEQQGDQGVGAGAVGAGGGAELAAFGGAQAAGGVVVVGAGAFDVGEGGAGDGVLPGGVAVEAVQRGGAAGGGGRGPPAAAARGAGLGGEAGG